MVHSVTNIRLLVVVLSGCVGGDLLHHTWMCFCSILHTLSVLWRICYIPSIQMLTHLLSMLVQRATHIPFEHVVKCVTHHLSEHLVKCATHHLSEHLVKCATHHLSEHLVKCVTHHLSEHVVKCVTHHLYEHVYRLSRLIGYTPSIWMRWWSVGSACSR